MGLTMPDSPRVSLWSRGVKAWRSDFRWRMYGAIVLVVLASSSLYTLYAIRVLENEAQGRLQDRADKLAGVLASALARPMFDINDQAVTSVVKALGATADLAHLAVFTPEDLLQAEVGSPPAATGFEGVAAMLPVTYHDGARTYTVGRVELALLAASTEQDLRQRVLQVVLANLLLAVAIVCLLYLLGRQMARPLADIQAALTALASGDTHIQLSGRERPDQVGRLSRAVWVFRDVLQRLQATEKQLLSVNAGLEAAVAERTRHLQDAVAQVRASQAQLQAIVDISTDAVILTDACGQVQSWNERATAMLGWAPALVLGQSLLALLQPQDEAGHTPEALAPFGTPGHWDPPAGPLETLVLCQAGHRLPVEWAMGQLDTALAGPPGAGLVCVFLRDLTQRRRAEEDTRTALARKAELYELRSRFIAMASHEFRTPLTSILSSVELLRHYRERMGAQEQDELLVSVETGVQRMTRMLDRVLVIGKADADKMAFSPRSLLLAELCHDVSVEARAHAPHSRCTLVEAFPPPGTQAFLDEELLRHILGNLLSNAFKYSPLGGEVLFEVRTEGDAWVFTVRDHGMGIPAQDLPHVFASFHRCGNATDIPGTGLGLAIVERAVALHQGGVTVESQPGQGTVFTVRLPQMASPDYLQ